MWSARVKVSTWFDQYITETQLDSLIKVFVIIFIISMRCAINVLCRSIRMWVWHIPNCQITSAPLEFSGRDMYDMHMHPTMSVNVFSIILHRSLLHPAILIGAFFVGHHHAHSCQLMHSSLVFTTPCRISWSSSCPVVSTYAFFTIFYQCLLQSVMSAQCTSMSDVSNSISQCVDLMWLTCQIVDHNNRLIQYDKWANSLMPFGYETID